jgi:hypothetical protein
MNNQTADQYIIRHERLLKQIVEDANIPAPQIKEAIL